ncbi:MAG: hypothetical protein PVH61_01910 [Candidatus Aminicenantes bacterium]
MKSIINLDIPEQLLNFMESIVSRTYGIEIMPVLYVLGYMNIYKLIDTICAENRVDQFLYRHERQ